MNEASLAQFEQIAKWSQVVCAIVFLVFLIWATRKWLVPAIAANTAARNAELVIAEKRRETTRVEVAEARAAVEAADRDALAIAQRAKDDAARERAHILAEAKADGERTVRNAEGELGRARLAAQSQLRQEFIERALERARADAAARIDAPYNTKLVNAAVDALSAGRPA